MKAVGVNCSFKRFSHEKRETYCTTARECRAESGEAFFFFFLSWGEPVGVWKLRRMRAAKRWAGWWRKCSKTDCGNGCITLWLDSKYWIVTLSGWMVRCVNYISVKHFKRIHFRKYWKTGYGKFCQVWIRPLFTVRLFIQSWKIFGWMKVLSSVAFFGDSC